MQQHVHAVPVGERGGREHVRDGEDAVEVCADEVPDALGLEEVVVKSTVGRRRVVRLVSDWGNHIGFSVDFGIFGTGIRGLDGRWKGTYSADRA